MDYIGSDKDACLEIDWWGAWLHWTRPSSNLSYHLTWHSMNVAAEQFAYILLLVLYAY